MGLNGSTCSAYLPVVTCDFEPPEHVPRTSTRAHTCAVGFGRAPCVSRSREHEKRPAAGRKKGRCAKSTHLNIVVYQVLPSERPPPPNLLRFLALSAFAASRLIRWPPCTLTHGPCYVVDAPSNDNCACPSPDAGVARQGGGAVGRNSSEARMGRSISVGARRLVRGAHRPQPVGLRK